MIKPETRDFFLWCMGQLSVKLDDPNFTDLATRRAEAVADLVGNTEKREMPAP